MAFPERLAKIRKSKGLTQEMLGELISITKAQIYRYERGSSQPTLDVIKKIALALNVSIDSLVFENGERKPDEELLLLFEGVARLDPEEKKLIKGLIEGVMIKHDAKRWMQQA